MVGMPIRRMPTVGDHVSVVFLAVRVAGVIESVDEAERRLHVLTEEGELIAFTLDRATGIFRTASTPDGRLVFEERPVT